MEEIINLSTYLFILKNRIKKRIRILGNGMSNIYMTKHIQEQYLISFCSMRKVHAGWGEFSVLMIETYTSSVNHHFDVENHIISSVQSGFISYNICIYSSVAATQLILLFIDIMRSKLVIRHYP